MSIDGQIYLKSELKLKDNYTYEKLENYISLKIIKFHNCNIYRLHHYMLHKCILPHTHLYNTNHNHKILHKLYLNANTA